MKAFVLVYDTQGLANDELQVTLASQQAFNQLELERPPYLKGLHFSVREVPEGLRVDISTEASLNHPALDFLLDFRWPDGHLLRRYTMLFDLPNGYGHVVKPKKKRSIQATHSISLETVAPKTYGPVTQKDQLIHVAYQLRPNSKTTVAQTALAIYEKNPNAFVNHDLHRLKQGAVLNSPTLDDVKKIDVQDADEHVWGSNTKKKGTFSKHKPGSTLVQQNDNLMTIARRVRPNKQVSVEQVAMALFQSNKKQLTDRNMHELSVDQVLRIPSLKMIQRISPKQAIAWVSEQEKAWKQQHAKQPLTPTDQTKSRIDQSAKSTAVSVSTSAVTTASEQLPTIQVAEDNTNGLLHLKDSYYIWIVGILLIGLLISRFILRFRARDNKVPVEAPVVASEVKQSGDDLSVVDLPGSPVLETVASDPTMELSMPDLKDPDPDQAMGDSDETAGFEEAAGFELEVSALEEVAVYMSYERYDQAESTLLEALKETPDHIELQVALLEVYEKQKDKAQFDAWASKLPSDLEQQQAELWKKSCR